jgi:hypothetical protein
MSGDWRCQLRHYSLCQHIEPYDFPQGRWPEQRAHKPVGLWISVEGGEDVWGWSDWCRVESWDIGPWEHAVTLAPDANVLHIGTPDDLRSFHREYEDVGNYGIRWRDVESAHDGIVITPYLWSMRLDVEVGWYYSWDCASGCIWKADAIADVTLLGATPALAAGGAR